MASPLISLVLAVKNGLPHVRQTIEALHRQTYSNFELIVQDGGSTDGTLEYLKASGIPRLDIESAPDAGIGQAYNRAVARASGALVCVLSADEFLEPDALQRGIELFERYPDAVLVNGAVRMVAEQDETVQIFESPQFDLLRHLSCEVVLAFAGLLNRAKIGSDFWFDEGLKTCPDYDFWIRLGSRFPPSDFVTVKAIFKTARADRASMSFRPESYVQFCRDKQFILDRFLGTQPPGPLVTAARRLARAGISLWAAESLYRLDPDSGAYLGWCEEAARFDPWSHRLWTLGAQSGAFSIERTTGRLLVGPRPQTNQPAGDTTEVPGALDLRIVYVAEQWKDVSLTVTDVVAIVTPAGPWHYAAAFRWTPPPGVGKDAWYWARLELEVLAGQVGVGMLVGVDIYHEQMVSPSAGHTTLFVKMTNPDARGVLIRNGPLAQRSVVRVSSITLEAHPRA